ncbi:hypothetical protein Cadr_000002601 [Camelus dromedarius]|uniref:Uncharacterized protein n=1 Tax=Camelus dromedarius TaxID=9838 RepID=A0A5N4C1G5_CAMDR|nr:hypothetical protein Cadr_000002601 [Camelus dromedarius]
MLSTPTASLPVSSRSLSRSRPIAPYFPCRLRVQFIGVSLAAQCLAQGRVSEVTRDFSREQARNCSGAGAQRRAPRGRIKDFAAERVITDLEGSGLRVSTGMEKPLMAPSGGGGMRQERYSRSSCAVCSALPRQVLITQTAVAVNTNDVSAGLLGRVEGGAVGAPRSLVAVGLWHAKDDMRRDASLREVGEHFVGLWKAQDVQSSGRGGKKDRATLVSQTSRPCCVRCPTRRGTVRLDFGARLTRTSVVVVSGPLMWVGPRVSLRWLQWSLADRVATYGYTYLQVRGSPRREEYRLEGSGGVAFSRAVDISERADPPYSPAVCGVPARQVLTTWISRTLNETRCSVVFGRLMVEVRGTRIAEPPGVPGSLSLMSVVYCSVNTYGLFSQGPHVLQLYGAVGRFLQAEGCKLGESTLAFSAGMDESCVRSSGCDAETGESYILHVQPYCAHCPTQTGAHQLHLTRLCLLGVVGNSNMTCGGLWTSNGAGAASVHELPGVKSGGLSHHLDLRTGKRHQLREGCKLDGRGSTFSGSRDESWVQGLKAVCERRDTGLVLHTEAMCVRCLPVGKAHQSVGCGGLWTGDTGGAAGVLELPSLNCGGPSEPARVQERCKVGGGESTFSKDMDESWARSSECGGNRGETLARVGEGGTKEGLRLEAMLCVVPNPEGRRSFISVRHGDAQQSVILGGLGSSGGGCLQEPCSPWVLILLQVHVEPVRRCAAGEGCCWRAVGYHLRRVRERVVCGHQDVVGRDLKAVCERRDTGLVLGIEAMLCAVPYPAPESVSRGGLWTGDVGSPAAAGDVGMLSVVLSTQREHVQVRDWEANFTHFLSRSSRFPWSSERRARILPLRDLYGNGKTFDGAIRRWWHETGKVLTFKLCCVQCPTQTGADHSDSVVAVNTNDVSAGLLGRVEGGAVGAPRSLVAVGLWHAKDDMRRDASLREVGEHFVGLWKAQDVQSSGRGGKKDRAMLVSQTSWPCCVRCPTRRGTVRLDFGARLTRTSVVVVSGPLMWVGPRVSLRWLQWSLADRVATYGYTYLQVRGSPRREEYRLEGSGGVAFSRAVDISEVRPSGVCVCARGGGGLACRSSPYSPAVCGVPARQVLTTWILCVGGPGRRTLNETRCSVVFGRLMVEVRGTRIAEPPGVPGSLSLMSVVYCSVNTYGVRLGKRSSYEKKREVLTFSSCTERLGDSCKLRDASWGRARWRFLRGWTSLVCGLQDAMRRQPPRTALLCALPYPDRGSSLELHLTRLCLLGVVGNSNMTCGGLWTSNGAGAASVHELPGVNSGGLSTHLDLRLLQEPELTALFLTLSTDRTHCLSLGPHPAVGPRRTGKRHQLREGCKLDGRGSTFRLEDESWVQGLKAVCERRDTGLVLHTEAMLRAVPYPVGKGHQSVLWWPLDGDTGGAAGVLELPSLNCGGPSEPARVQERCKVGGGESTFSKDMDESWARSSECGGNRGETLARVGEGGTKEGLRLEAMLCAVPNPEGRRSFISVRHGDAQQSVILGGLGSSGGVCLQEPCSPWVLILLQVHVEPVRRCAAGEGCCWRAVGYHLRRVRERVVCGHQDVVGRDLKAVCERRDTGLVLGIEAMLCAVPYPAPESVSRGGLWTGDVGSPAAAGDVGMLSVVLSTQREHVQVRDWEANFKDFAAERVITDLEGSGLRVSTGMEKPLMAPSGGGGMRQERYSVQVCCVQCPTQTGADHSDSVVAVNTNDVSAGLLGRVEGGAVGAPRSLVAVGLWHAKDDMRGMHSLREVGEHFVGLWKAQDVQSSGRGGKKDRAMLVSQTSWPCCVRCPTRRGTVRLDFGARLTRTSVVVVSGPLMWVGPRVSLRWLQWSLADRVATYGDTYLQVRGSPRREEYRLEGRPWLYLRCDHQDVCVCAWWGWVSVQILPLQPCCVRRPSQTGADHLDFKNAQRNALFGGLWAIDGGSTWDPNSVKSCTERLGDSCKLRDASWGRARWRFLRGWTSLVCGLQDAMRRQPPRTALLCALPYPDRGSSLELHLTRLCLLGVVGNSNMTCGGLWTSNGAGAASVHELPGVNSGGLSHPP